MAEPVLGVIEPVALVGSLVLTYVNACGASAPSWPARALCCSPPR
ncbi:hypothetical protein [Streptomyces sp. NPDC049915]